MTSDVNAFMAKLDVLKAKAVELDVDWEDDWDDSENEWNESFEWEVE